MSNVRGTARIASGLVFLGFGIAKFANHSVEVDSFETYGLPAPDAFVYAIGAIEVIGSLMLIAGAGARLAALVLAGDMVGANAVSGIKEGELAGTRIRVKIAELDRKIKAQIQALEKGIEPELVSERIAELRGEKQALEEAVAEVGTEREEAEAEELSEQLARMPDLTQRLLEASPEVQRQVFEAFEPQILYDKAEGRIEISATVSEAVANAFEKEEALPKEGSLVGLRDIAGAGFEPATFGL